MSINMSDPIIKRIVKARVKMLMNQSMAFFGTLAIRLMPKEIDKQYCRNIHKWQIERKIQNMNRVCKQSVSRNAWWNGIF